MWHTHQSGCFILHDIIMKLVLLGFAGSTQPTTFRQDVASDAVGAASAAIKIRGSPYFIPIFRTFLYSVRGILFEPFIKAMMPKTGALTMCEEHNKLATRRELI